MSNRNGGKWIRPEKRLAIYIRDGLACVYCSRSGVREAGQLPARLTLDHLHPRALGGTNHESNLITACRDCNNARHKRALDVWLTSLFDCGVAIDALAQRIKHQTSLDLTPFKAQATTMMAVDKATVMAIRERANASWRAENLYDNDNYSQ